MAGEEYRTGINPRYIPYRENWNRQPDEIEQWLMNQRDRLQGGLSRAGGSVMDFVKEYGPRVGRFAMDIGADPLTMYGPGLISQALQGRTSSGSAQDYPKMDLEYETKIEPIKVTKVKKKKKKYKRKAGQHPATGGY